MSNYKTIVKTEGLGHEDYKVLQKDINESIKQAFNKGWEVKDIQFTALKNYYSVLIVYTKRVPVNPVEKGGLKHWVK